jgi:adenine phosphoribosyltransferase
MNTSFNLDSAIRKIPDFPKEGILFYDLSSILTNPAAFTFCIDRMKELYIDGGYDAVAAIEARGFLFAAPFALAAGLPLILVRKKGKLPGETIGKKFALEYGEDEVEIHVHDIPSGGNILIVDDLIATGGTIKAAAELFEEGGAGKVEIFSVVGLPFLDYEKELRGFTITTLINYDSE